VCDDLQSGKRATDSYQRRSALSGGVVDDGQSQVRTPARSRSERARTVLAREGVGRVADQERGLKSLLWRQRDRHTKEDWLEGLALPTA
jgi:hypothetical protein